MKRGRGELALGGGSSKWFTISKQLSAAPKYGPLWPIPDVSASAYDRTVYFVPRSKNGLAARIDERGWQHSFTRN